MGSRQKIEPPGECLDGKAHHWLIDQLPIHGLYHARCRHCSQETAFPAASEKGERLLHTWVDYTKKERKKRAEV